jgi:hypothetical protein
MIKQISGTSPRKRRFWANCGDSCCKERVPVRNLLFTSAMIWLRRFVPLLVVALSTVRAVILFSTGDPTANTTAPAGTLAGSGWQYEAIYGAFLGTPIGPFYFVTAQHIGIQSNTLTYHGVDYSVVRWFDDPASDLRIFEVSQPFPSYAPLYSASNEVGQTLVVIGRGTQRGDPVYLGNTLLGWYWGTQDSVQRWGENQVTGVQDNLLFATFDQNGTSNEAHLSAGDSGGAFFINDNGTWKLAGINYAVDGPYHFSPGDSGFVGALFDTRGLYDADGQFISGAAPVPSAMYATRISNRLSWIRSVIDQEITGISGRASVTSANSVSSLFVVNGASSLTKRVIVRGLGPSLSVNGYLADPSIQLFNSKGALIASNDNWKTGSNRTINAIKATGLAPTSSKESALIASLPPGTYTAVLRGVHRTSGIGLLDVRDLDSGENLLMGNLAVRANVGVGTGALVNGLILQNTTKQLLLRAIGPELRNQGVSAPLDDPALDLYDANGNLIATNDNWRNAPNSGDIQNTGLAPNDDREPAILLTPAAGNYSVTVRGSNGGTGVCQLEAYLLP